MTTKQTLQVLKSAGKSVSLVHLYRLFKIIGIRPLGRARPQQYPPDTAERIKAHLGIESPEEYHGYVQDCMAGHAKIYAKPAKVISTRALRAARPQTKKKGTK